MSDDVKFSYRSYEVAQNGDYTIDPNVENGKDVHGRDTMRIKLDAKSGQSFIFEVSSQTIAVQDINGKPLTGDALREAMLGDTVITPTERAEAFRYILANKRQHTVGDGGWRGAAIVVSDDGHAYVGVNTKTQKPYFKDCAEQNAVNALVSRSDIYPHLEAGEWQSDVPAPTLPKVEATYVMGGREAGTSSPTDPGSPLSCPCGKCTDMLSQIMDKDSLVYSMPVPDERTLLPLNFLDSKAAQSLNDVGVSPPVNAWVTPISHLNQHRNVALSDPNIAKQGIKALHERLNVRQADAEKLRREKPASMLEQMLNTPSSIVMNVIKQGEKIGLEMNNEGLADPLARRAAVAAQAVENILLNRESIPEIDAATKQGADAQFAAINKFMVDRIEATVADRMYAAYTQKPYKYPNAKAALKDVGETICTVIELTDGTFYTGMEATGKFDKAAPASEVNALTAAMSKLGSQSVKNVWVMEYDPKDVEKGVMETTPKEGVERILKRLKRGSSLDFHFVPFNDGSNESAKAAQSLTQNFSPEQIFPGLFTGNNDAQPKGLVR